MILCLHDEMELKDVQTSSRHNKSSILWFFISSCDTRVKEIEQNRINPFTSEQENIVTGAVIQNTSSFLPVLHNQEHQLLHEM